MALATVLQAHAQITTTAGSALKVSHGSSVVGLSGDFFVVEPSATLHNDGLVSTPEPVMLDDALANRDQGRHPR